MSLPAKLRVALITIDYPPQRTSAAVQMRDLAQEMRRQGHEPTVIVPSTDILEPWLIEKVGDIEVLRVRSRPTRDIGYLLRTLNEALFAVTIPRAVAQSPLRNANWDLVAWYSPTIFFGPLVAGLKRRSSAHAYLILRDIFPEWTVDLGIMRKGVGYWLFRAVAAYQYSVADTIGVQTESNLSYLSGWVRKGGRSLEVLRNWQHEGSNVGSSIDLSRTSLAGKSVFAYIGNMGVAQGMDALLELAESLLDRQDIGFLFVGRGSEVDRLRVEIVRRGLVNSLLFDEIPAEEVPGLLAQCRAGLIALHPLHRSHNIPGKFLSYLNAGLPVLACVNENTDLMSLINDRNVGHAGGHDALGYLKKCATRMIDETEVWSTMSANARMLSKEMFSPEAIVRQIVSRVRL